MQKTHFIRVHFQRNFGAGFAPHSTECFLAPWGYELWVAVRSLEYDASSFTKSLYESYIQHPM